MHIGWYISNHFRAITHWRHGTDQPRPRGVSLLEDIFFGFDEYIVKESNAVFTHLCNP